MLSEPKKAQLSLVDSFSSFDPHRSLVGEQSFQQEASSVQNAVRFESVQQPYIQVRHERRSALQHLLQLAWQQLVPLPVQQIRAETA